MKNKPNMVIGGAMLSPKNISPRDLIDSKNHIYVGSNTGNLIIGEFGRMPIMQKTNYEASNLPFVVDKDLDFINSCKNGIVIFPANWLATYMKHDFTQVNEFLKQVKVPVTMIGLGSHTPYEDFDIKGFVESLNPTLIDFIRIVSKKNSSISVRGFTTKKY